MTKTKFKNSFSSSSIPLSPAPPDHSLDADEDDLPPHFSQFGPRFMPFGAVTNKRKRGPRGAPRFSQKDSIRSQCDGFSDSARDSSSSQRSDENDDDIVESAQERSDGHHGTSDGSLTPSDATRRGSVRMKVKPSKFREDTSFRNNIPEGNLPSKKRISGNFVEYAADSKRDMLGTQDHLTEELKAALTVVKKIMKMEAAEPFNIPVDPIALGIPDYFDIVKRPMDLGTIRERLEIGGKYRNSQDVYEDIQLVWTNCRIYNHKGDPILDLLARVRKNFMKYWTAAGLYTEKASAFRFQNISPDAVQSEMVVPSIRQKDSLDEQSKTTDGTIKEAVKQEDSTLKHSGATEIKAPKRPPDEFVNGLLGEQEAAFNLLNGDLDAFFLNPEGSNIISVYKSQKKKKVEQQDAAKEQSIQPPTPKVHLQEDEKNVMNSVKHIENSNNEHHKMDTDSVKDKKVIDSGKSTTDGDSGKSMKDNDSLKSMKDNDSLKSMKDVDSTVAADKIKKDSNSQDKIKKDADSLMVSGKNKNDMDSNVIPMKKKKKKKKKDADSEDKIKKDTMASAMNKDPELDITSGKNKKDDSNASSGKNAKGAADPHVTSGKQDIDPNATSSKLQKDGDSGKPRRVSGTGHHKADCSCVVCTGVRRKLAREGKLGTIVIKTSEDVANSPGPERLVLRLKTEPINDGSKPNHRLNGGQRTKERKDEHKAEESFLANDKEEIPEKTKTNDDVIDVTDQFNAGDDNNAKEDDSPVARPENNDGAIEEPMMMEQTKEISAGDMKDCTEEDPKGILIEDAEDMVQNEEQFVDTEAYRQEGGVRYYRASYEMPLRKINPAILEMGHRLFGKGSPWNNGRSLGNHSMKDYSGSSVMSTVSMLLRGT